MELMFHFQAIWFKNLMIVATMPFHVCSVASLVCLEINHVISITAMYWLSLANIEFTLLTAQFQVAMYSCCPLALIDYYQVM